MRLPYITSIPPHLKRINAAGADVGASYQQACIASWLDQGFAPCSVNSVNEQVDCGVAIRRVERDATAITGKPHAYFADLLKAGIEQASSGPFVIGNADVILKPGIKDEIARLQPGELFFSRRIDIQDAASRDGEPYDIGFDLFAITCADAARFIQTRLIFGAPWWDHYLPLMMLMTGGRLGLMAPSVFHLVHEERWNWPLWTRLGTTFLEEVEAASTNAYRDGLTEAKREPWLGWRKFMRDNVLKPATQEQRTAAALHRISSFNVRLINEHARAVGHGPT